MTFDELKTEFYARGFEYLNEIGAANPDDRAGRWLNQAYLEICEAEDWPFLTSTATGNSPLTITDLGTVEFVRDETNGQILRAIDPRDIAEVSSLSQTGTPEFFYIDNGVIQVYPVSTVSLSVRYWKIASELVGTTDTPLIPTRYQYAIVDYAVARAYMDSDSPEYAAAARLDGDKLVSLMRDRLLFRQHQDPEMIAVYGNSSDW